MNIELSRGERGTLRWKVLTGGIVVFRLARKRDALRIKKNLHKVYNRLDAEWPKAAAFLAATQDEMDNDVDPYFDHGPTVGCDCAECA